MRIKISRSKNSESYFLIKDIYKNGKRTTKVVEALGKKRTEEDKTENAKIMVAYNPNKQIPKGTQRSFNIGYFFLQSIYHQLKLDEICHSISKKYNFSLT